MPTILPDPAHLQLECLSADSDVITMMVASTATSACCPLCSQSSDRIHSRYIRTLADLPWNGVAVRLQLTVHRFFCATAGCRRRIFAERMPAIAAPYARRTVRLTEVLRLIGFAVGGEAGARLLAGLAMTASPDTVLRVIRSALLPPRATPRVLGIDDFAFRRGRRYGTILVDLERHCRVDLLPDRRAETVASWLREHPGVEIVARDRAEAYADGVAQGAPRAVQVADRFHLVKNLTNALQDVFNRQKRHLPTIETDLAAGDELETERLDALAGASPLAGSRAQRHGQQACRAQRKERYDQLMALRDRGVSIQEAAAQVGIGKRTANRWIAAGGFPERKIRRRSASAIDAFEEYIQQRWDEGCRNRTQLWRELCDQGYRGSYPSVYQYVVRLQAGLLTAGGGAHAPPRARRRLSPRQAAWLLLRGEDMLTTHEREQLAALKEACSDAQTAHPLTQQFLSLVRERKHEDLDQWICLALGSGLPELERFAAGLRRDEAAVQAALRIEHSNGQTEGQVNRLKLVKRQMYGRGNFDLLRQRVLHTA